MDKQSHQIKEKISWYKSVTRVIPLIINTIVEKNLFTQSAALSYYCALSLAPFIILTIFSLSFLGFQTEQAFSNQIQQIVGDKAAEAILIIIQGAREDREIRGISGIIGLITLLVSASAVFSQLKTTIISIFTNKNACEIEAGGNFWDFLKDKVFSIGMMTSFIFISLISLMLSSVISIVMPEDTAFIWQALNLIISFIIYAAVFFLVFYFVSNRRVAKKDAIIGGGISSFLFILGRTIISIYLSESAIGSAYGAAGSLIVLLVWVYYSSFIVFVSGAITRHLKDWRELTPQN